MLNMPKNQLACQLAQRIEKIVDYLSPMCDENWVRNYSGYMRALNQSSKPADGSECPSLEIENHPGARRFNENFAMENQGKNFHAHVKEAVDAGNAQYKAEQTAQKEAIMSAERARKQEIMDQRNAERQALAAKREERRQLLAQKKAEREDSRRSKLLRQQTSAREAYEKAMEELRRQQAALAEVSEAVNQVLGVQTSNNEVIMMNDIEAEDVIISIEEVEEEGGVDSRMFGATREEISGPADFSMFNFHAECEMPPATEFKNMAMKAEAKFDKILASSVEGTVRNGGGVRKQLANRLAFRFNEVIDFVLSVRRMNVCEIPKLRCYDLDAVFGMNEVSSIEQLIAHSTELVEQLERQCPRVLFATYYMTLDGKADRLM